MCHLQYRIMQKKISEIASIQYGTYTKALEKGEVKYLVASHFNKFFKLRNFSSSYIKMHGTAEKFQLRANDVILAAKGSRNFAWAYKEKSGPCVPSSAFFIIRANPSEITGEFLANVLNSKLVQYQIKNMATGGGMPSIPKKEFNELEVFVPSLAFQKKVVKMAGLLDEDIELTAELLKQKKQLKTGVINKMITSKMQT